MNTKHTLSLSLALWLSGSLCSSSLACIGSSGLSSSTRLHSRWSQPVSLLCTCRRVPSTCGTGRSHCACAYCTHCPLSTGSSDVLLPFTLTFTFSFAFAFACRQRPLSATLSAGKTRGEAGGSPYSSGPSSSDHRQRARCQPTLRLCAGKSFWYSPGRLWYWYVHLCVCVSLFFVLPVCLFVCVCACLHVFAYLCVFPSLCVHSGS
jgi:hypothetical protein